MFINEQIGNYQEMDVSFMNAEDAATDDEIYDDCFIYDLVKMYMST